MAGLPEHPQVLAWVIVKHDGYLNVALLVLLNALDDSNLSRQSDVHDVAAGTRV